MEYLDIRDVFLNFVAHGNFNFYCGVDMFHVRFNNPYKDEWEVKMWNEREILCMTMMGLQPSSLFSTQKLLWGK